MNGKVSTVGRRDEGDAVSELLKLWKQSLDDAIDAQHASTAFPALAEAHKARQVAMLQVCERLENVLTRLTRARIVEGLTDTRKHIAGEWR